MGLFNKLLGKKEEKKIDSAEAFWAWFAQHEQSFHDSVKQRKNIEKVFLDKVLDRLAEWRDGFYILTGMSDDDTVEMIITPDGIIKNIIFVEELIAAAPEIPGWKFTALKPGMGGDGMAIEMQGYKFDKEKLSFFANEKEAYPDEIEITLVHKDFTEENKSIITNGSIIYLDNLIGELNFVTSIDHIEVMGSSANEQELIPIEKLPAYLEWRKKEFIEKYDGVHTDTAEDTFSIMEATLPDDKPLIAIINTKLLKWEAKASHPWIAVLVIKFDGSENNGMPDNTEYEQLNAIEDDAMQYLSCDDGYLNVGRQTVDGVREVYFACKEFRHPSKVLDGICKKYAEQFEMDLEIYVDKYWRSFEKFQQQ